MVVEPESVVSQRQDIIKNANRFHSIYTFDKHIIDTVPHARLWIARYCDFGDKTEMFIKSVEEKDFKISTYASSKIFSACEGHHIRTRMFFNHTMFPDNLVFFRSGRPNPGPFGDMLPDLTGHTFYDNWQLHFGFQFNIVIENTKEVNYFTEKLMNCFLGRTIPIYWGCPNIDDFFDTTGWIIWKDIPDLIDKLSIIDENYYVKYMDIIEKNHIFALENYSNFYKSFERQKTLITSSSRILHN